jgi:hypothetical protein
MKNEEGGRALAEPKLTEKEDSSRKLEERWREAPAGSWRNGGD